MLLILTPCYVGPGTSRRFFGGGQCESLSEWPGVLGCGSRSGHSGALCHGGGSEHLGTSGCSGGAGHPVLPGHCAGSRCSRLWQWVQAARPCALGQSSRAKVLGCGGGAVVLVCNLRVLGHGCSLQPLPKEYCTDPSKWPVISF